MPHVLWTCKHGRLRQSFRRRVYAPVIDEHARVWDLLGLRRYEIERLYEVFVRIDRDGTIVAARRGVTNMMLLQHSLIWWLSQWDGAAALPS